EVADVDVLHALGPQAPFPVPDARPKPRKTVASDPHGHPLLHRRIGNGVEISLPRQRRQVNTKGEIVAKLGGVHPCTSAPSGALYSPIFQTTAFRARRSRLITLASPSRSTTLARLRQSSIASSRMPRPRTTFGAAAAGVALASAA